MAQFILTYLGGDHPTNPEEAQKHMAQYQEWLGALGDKAVSPMNPLKNSHTISPDGSVSKESSISMSGYTTIEVATIEDALEIAKACPFLQIGGTLEVSELVIMPHM